MSGVLLHVQQPAVGLLEPYNINEWLVMLINLWYETEATPVVEPVADPVPASATPSPTITPAVPSSTPATPTNAAGSGSGSGSSSGSGAEAASGMENVVMGWRFPIRLVARDFDALDADGVAPMGHTAFVWEDTDRDAANKLLEVRHPWRADLCFDL